MKKKEEKEEKEKEEKTWSICLAAKMFSLCEHQLRSDLHPGGSFSLPICGFKVRIGGLEVVQPSLFSPPFPIHQHSNK